MFEYDTPQWLIMGERPPYRASNYGETIRGYDNDDITDWILAMRGNDLVDGRRGNDMLLGEGGNDSVIGGLGSDFIVGGTGNDQLWGGMQQYGGPSDGAQDIFDLRGADVGCDAIYDFEPTLDRLLVHGTPGNMPFAEEVYIEGSFLGTVVDLGNGNSLMLMGLPTGLLTLSNFLFDTSPY